MLRVKTGALVLGEYFHRWAGGQLGHKLATNLSRIGGVAGGGGMIGEGRVVYHAMHTLFAILCRAAATFAQTAKNLKTVLPT